MRMEKLVLSQVAGGDGSWRGGKHTFHFTKYESRGLDHILWHRLKRSAYL